MANRERYKTRGKEILLLDINYDKYLETDIEVGFFRNEGKPQKSVQREVQEDDPRMI